MTYSNIYIHFVEKDKDKQYIESEFKSQANEITEIIKGKLGLLTSYFSNAKTNSKINLDDIFFDLTRNLGPKEVRQVYNREKLEESKDRAVALTNDLSSNFILFLWKVLEKSQSIPFGDIEMYEKGVRHKTISSNIDLENFQSICILNQIYIKKIYS